MDTFVTLYNRLMLRATGVGQFLAADLIRDSLAQLAARRQWSWLQKQGAFYPQSVNTTGDSVAVTPNLYTVTSTLGNFTPAMVGLQIRVGNSASSYPTYTITSYVSPNLVLTDRPWSGPALTAQSYIVFQCYFPVPADFESFVSLVSPTQNMRLWTNLSQSQLDTADAQRVTTGPSFGAAFFDYTSSWQGTVGSVLPVYATGATPISTTSYGFSFPVNSTYSVRITTSGAVGTCAFAWKQDTGSYSTPATVADTNPIDLSNGVQIYFPTGSYTSGDTFIIPCQAQSSPSVARYELWPRPLNTPYVYPYRYISVIPALTDQSPALPPFIASRGDVLLEMALTRAAMFPGTPTAKNPYYDLNLASIHREHAERLIWELEKHDDDTAAADLTYAGWEFAPTPWFDGSYLQSHAWPYATW